MYVKHTHIIYVFRGGDALFFNNKNAVIFHKYNRTFDDTKERHVQALCFINSNRPQVD